MRAPWRGRLRERLDLRRATGGADVFPLVVLFGLNAVDELDRAAFSVLTPEIRDHFGLDTAGILGVIGASSVLVVLLTVFIGYFADRSNRVRMATGGAAAWMVFSVFTGLAPAIGILVLARVGAGLARAVNEPTHNSLLADFYPIEVRTSVYGVHRAANSVGMFVGPFSAGVLAWAFGWRAPFFLFAVPTAIFVVLALRLREPTRGVHERRAGGAGDDAAETEDEPPSWSEAWQMLWQVRALRRSWAAFPFLAIPTFGLLSLYSLYYQEVFGLNEAQRGLLSSMTEPFQLLGLVIGIPILTRMTRDNPGNGIKLLATIGAVGTVALAGLAVSPNLPVAILFNVALSSVTALLLPTLFAAGSLIIPPRARSMGFSAGVLFFLPGALFLPVIGALADAWGVRTALLVTVPVLLIGYAILVSSAPLMNVDVARIRATAAAQAEARRAREQGDPTLLLVRGLDVSYGGTQVLFGVDFDVRDGEIVALLGTNGAGKSTLLKAISGLVPADGGAVVFDGVDISSSDAIRNSMRAITQMPGGRGIFPNLTVAENLRAAAWLYRRDAAYVREATDRILEEFPVLRERWRTKGGSLSGGQQQMLSLGMAFVARPRLLMIDELTLGLAPTVVDQLIEIVRAIHANGTSIVLVEQSVNTALRIADRAVFMEKGEVRFSGPTKKLLKRDDILRAVFLRGTAALAGNGKGSNGSSGANGSRRRKRPAGAAATKLENADLVLETLDLTKRYGGVTAVDGVSLELRRGEILGLIGPNGAGKTTVMDLVSGFQRADGGQVWLHGCDVTGWAAARRATGGLGRGFQDARLFPSLTVRENLAVALERSVEAPEPLLAALGLPAVRDSERALAQRVEELIELIGLGAFRDKFVSELSTGSRRMVELAGIIGHRPSVLLLDEPSSGIAQREAEALGPVLRQVREELDCSILLIEHDMPLLSGLVDRVMALDQGAVVTVGSVDDVLAHPQVVASYLGTTDQSVLTR